MNDEMISPQLPSIITTQRRLSVSQNATLLIVVSATALVTASALSRSFYDGRLSAPITQNDVNYFVLGIQYLTLMRTQGLIELLVDFIHGYLHAPLSTYQAMLAFSILGIKDWAPYFSNVVYLAFFLGFATHLLRGCPITVVTAGMMCLMSMPLSSNMITEFAPETVCSLFTAIAVILMLRLPLFAAPMRSRGVAGLYFGIAYLGHPVAFPFTTVALLGTIGIVFLRDVVFDRKLEMIGSGIRYSFLNIGLSVLLPTLYMGPRFHRYFSYFYDALINPATAPFWATNLSTRDQLKIFLSGTGGQFMFGNLLWAYLGLIALGIASSWWCGNRRLFSRQLELLPLVFMFWLVPTIPVSTNYLFGQSFGFTIGFLMVFALRSVYEMLDGITGKAVALAIGVVLVLFEQSSFSIPNVPQNNGDRVYALSTVDRIDKMLLGNSVNHNSVKVYMTNVGAFAPNILQYYLLKTDPTLNWTLDSKWTDADIQHQFDVIRGSPKDPATMQDFVIAGQADNGETDPTPVRSIEDTLFTALRDDPTYMAIDNFYGSRGREITIFQRRGNFAGWHSVSGLTNPTGRHDDQRESRSGRAYLQAYAARAVPANLEIEWLGMDQRQELSVIVNHEKVAELNHNGGNGTSSLRQEISLSAGMNDIVLLSDKPFALRHLVVAPYILAKIENQGIQVATATFGGNCGGPQGNVTIDVASRCDAKMDCDYTVDWHRLGDPAPNCKKDFDVSYFCPSEFILRRKTLTPEAGIGKVVQLNCVKE